MKALYNLHFPDKVALVSNFMFWQKTGICHGCIKEKINS
jgi:hypothetical protein